MSSSSIQSPNPHTKRKQFFSSFIENEDNAQEEQNKDQPNDQQSVDTVIKMLNLDDQTEQNQQIPIQIQPLDEDNQQSFDYQPDYAPRTNNKEDISFRDAVIPSQYDEGDLIGLKSRTTKQKQLQNYKQDRESTYQIMAKRKRQQIISKINIIDINNKEHQEILQDKNKTIKDITFLKNAISDLALFQKNPDLLNKQNTTQSLFKEFSYEKFQKNDVIFNVGDFGYTYYIVLKGAVYLLIPKLTKNDNREEKDKVIKKKNESPSKDVSSQRQILDLSKQLIKSQQNSRVNISEQNLKSQSFISKSSIGEYSQSNRTVQNESDQQNGGWKIIKSNLNILKSNKSKFLLQQNSLEFVEKKQQEQEDEAAYLKKNYDDMNLIKTFIAGEAFGEIALMTKQRRTGTMVCKEETHLMTLSKSGFDKILGEFHEQIKSERLGFLKRYDFFENIPNSNILSVLLDIKIQTLPKKTILYNQNDEVKNIYFLKQGEIQQSKSVLVSQYQQQQFENKQNSLCLLESNEGRNNSLKDDIFKKYHQNQIIKHQKMQYKKILLTTQGFQSHFGCEDLLEHLSKLNKKVLHLEQREEQVITAQDKTQKNMVTLIKKVNSEKKDQEELKIQQLNEGIIDTNKSMRLQTPPLSQFYQSFQNQSNSDSHSNYNQISSPIQDRSFSQKQQSCNDSHHQDFMSKYASNNDPIKLNKQQLQLSRQSEEKTFSNYYCNNIERNSFSQNFPHLQNNISPLIRPQSSPYKNGLFSSLDNSPISQRIQDLRQKSAQNYRNSNLINQYSSQDFKVFQRNKFESSKNKNEQNQLSRLSLPLISQRSKSYSNSQIISFYQDSVINDDSFTKFKLQKEDNKLAQKQNEKNLREELSQNKQRQSKQLEQLQYLSLNMNLLKASIPFKPSENISQLNQNSLKQKVNNLAQNESIQQRLILKSSSTRIRQLQKLEETCTIPNEISRNRSISIANSHQIVDNSDLQTLRKFDSTIDQRIDHIRSKLAVDVLKKQYSKQKFGVNFQQELKLKSELLRQSQHQQGNNTKNLISTFPTKEINDITDLNINLFGKQSKYHSIILNQQIQQMEIRNNYDKETKDSHYQNNPKKCVDNKKSRQERYNLVLEYQKTNNAQIRSSRVKIDLLNFFSEKSQQLANKEQSNDLQRLNNVSQEVQLNLKSMILKQKTEKERMNRRQIKPLQSPRWQEVPKLPQIKVNVSVHTSFDKMKANSNLNVQTQDKLIKQGESNIQVINIHTQKAKQIIGSNLHKGLIQMIRNKNSINQFKKNIFEQQIEKLNQQTTPKFIQQQQIK